MQEFEVELSNEFIELHNLLKITNVASSGGQGKHIVASGDVQVDGKQELRKACKIRAGQVVQVGDAILIRVVAAAAE
ncbi:MAG: RNA-binding S4 domain-containing protein [Iodobacter sp.]|jgi:ribosome-associated protein